MEPYGIRVIAMAAELQTAMTENISTGTTQSLGIRLTAQDIADAIVAAVEPSWLRRAVHQCAPRGPAASDRVLRTEGGAQGAPGATIGQFWDRFPKFVPGFIAASMVHAVPAADGGKTSNTVIATVNELRTWFLIFAFVSIGLEFSLKGLREAGWRPVAVFASATVVNIVVALGPGGRVVRQLRPELAVTLAPCRQPGRGEAFSR